MNRYALLFPVLLMLAVPLIGEEGQFCGCPNCGCCNLDSVCRLVPSKVKETKTIYCCKKEDVCLPGKSSKCGKECIPDCEARKGYRFETLWQPGCGKIITKTALMKKTVTEEKEFALASCSSGAATAVMNSIRRNLREGIERGEITGTLRGKP